jgi:4-amino-4-deoxy-L-arabinose transferase-like glycosyltransferase
MTLIAQRADQNAFGVSKTLLHLSLIFIAGLFIYGLWLGDSPLDRTEPFRALVAHQMVHGSSWLVPRLYGELYLRKPPLIYWIEASVELLVGRGNEWVWRTPSVVGSAFLAAFLAWWAGRWFGASARLPSGFACLALVALWDQNRSADIDALNTVTAIVSTICVLELGHGISEISNLKSRIGWTIGLGLAVGAMLLLKGPGGLPQLLGAIVGPAIVLRSWKRVRWPSLVIGILIGLAMFAAYVIAAKMAMQQAHIVADKTGWYEVIEKIFLGGWKKRLLALVMPVELLAFALPVSAVLPIAVMMIRRLPGDDVFRQRALAILGTLGAGLIIWMIEGNDNPRYEYVMLPLLAPVVGFVWAGRAQRRGLAEVLLGACVLFCGGTLAIALKLPHEAPGRAGVVGGLVLSVVVLVGMVFLNSVRLRRGKALAAEAASPVLGVGVVALLLLFALPMAARKNAERIRKSAKAPAAKLREDIGDARVVLAAGVVRDLPELFYYAGVDVDAYGEFGLPQLAAVRGGHWVVLSENEKYPAYSTIQKYIPGALSKVRKLPMADPRDIIYVGWYDPPAGADTRIEWKVGKAVDSDE